MLPKSVPEVVCPVLQVFRARDNLNCYVRVFRGASLSLQHFKLVSYGKQFVNSFPMLRVGPDLGASHKKALVAPHSDLWLILPVRDSGLYILVLSLCSTLLKFITRSYL